MNFDRVKRKKFHISFIVFQILSILLCAHFVLSVGEPEGFIEIFSEKGFVKQFAIHVVGLSILVLALNWINKKEVERFHTTRNMRIFFYLCKAVFIPVVFTFLFSYLYFLYFNKKVSVGAYINQLWPFLVFFFLFGNVMLFIRYMLKWTILSFAPNVDDRLELSFARKKELVALAKVVLCVREGRSIRVYLADGKTYLSSNSIVQLKEKTQNDPRFFATGSWIVCHTVIEEVLDGPTTRSKQVMVSFRYDGQLIVPKERVSEFTMWLANSRY